MTRKQLTNQEISSAKPGDRAYKLYAGGGLYVEDHADRQQALAIQVPLWWKREKAGLSANTARSPARSHSSKPEKPATRRRIFFSQSMTERA